MICSSSYCVSTAHYRLDCTHSHSYTHRHMHTYMHKCMWHTLLLHYLFILFCSIRLTIIRVHVTTSGSRLCSVHMTRESNIFRMKELHGSWSGGVCLCVWDDWWTWGRVCLSMIVSHSVPPYFFSWSAQSNSIHSLFIGVVWLMLKWNMKCLSPYGRM